MMLKFIFLSFFSIIGSHLSLAASLSISSDLDINAVVDRLTELESIVPYKKNININSVEGSFLGVVDIDRSGKSSTLFSVGWQVKGSKAPVYMVLSDGWWEHKVKRGLYFVVDNSQHAFCFVDGYKLPSRAVFIAVSWGQVNGKQYCQIFVDGNILKNTEFSLDQERESYGLAMFSDAYTDSRRGRSAYGRTSNWIYLDKKIDWRLVKNIAEELKLRSSSSSAVSNNSKWSHAIKKKVLFDEDIYWALRKENTDEIIKFLKKMNFNVYIPCVWHGGGAYYPRIDGLIDERLNYRINILGEDPLSYLIVEAKKNGIEVHPWFTVVKRKGGILEKFALSDTEHAFNIHNASFRNFAVDLVVDVVRRYKPDGINLDYIRSIGQCRTAKCREDFQRQYGHNLNLAILKSRIPGLESEFVSTWNYQAVTSIVRDISSAAKKLDAQIEMSVDAHPMSKELLLQGQDSIAWENEGLIDTIYSMDYKLNPNFRNMFDAKKRMSDDNALVPLFSLYSIVDNEVVPRDIEVIDTYIKQSVENLSTERIAFYHRKQLSEHHFDYFSR